jgi:hypothetical protein
MEDTSLRRAKQKITNPALCVIGQGSIRGSRRVTGWVVICPDPGHEDLQLLVHRKKRAAQAAQFSHVENFHPSGDVLIG